MPEGRNSDAALHRDTNFLIINSRGLIKIQPLFKHALCFYLFVLMLD
jgi:hypothetical protein